MRGSNSRLPGLAEDLTYSVGLPIHYECAGVLRFLIAIFFQPLFHQNQSQDQRFVCSFVHVGPKVRSNIDFIDMHSC
jgi:hypothetical protein